MNLLSSLSQFPIGAFDSGVGGLTVVRAIQELLPFEDIVYLGDTARLPYGDKSPETIIRYSLEINSFLARQKIKALVVACNTASAHALAVLQAKAHVPVIGVISPGVQAALASTRTRKIGILGTKGTIASAAYQKMLRQLCPEVEITARSAPLLVPVVEENWLKHPATRLILEEYLAPLQAASVDTVVLACTHYPLIKPLAREILGPGVTLVDSAENAALTLREVLNENRLAREESENFRGKISIRVTDLSPQFIRLAEQFLGQVVDDFQQVDLPSI